MSPLARRLVAVVTLLLALALIAVLTLRAFGAPIALGPLASATPIPAPTASPEASGAPTPSPDDVLAGIEADVADIRDLAAADIGPPELITREELDRRLTARFEQDYPPEDVAADNVLLQGLGLLTADEDVAALQLQLLTGGVLGYYDPDAQAMVVVTDAGLTPGAQVTYAHEYTHALQDSAFGMDTLDLQRRGDDDGAMAGLSLLEGDATTTMVLWAIDNLSPEEVLGISQTPLPDTTGVPAWMIRQQEFPYLAGTDFTSRLYATAGFGAVDEAWADPPISTEQILHFRAYTDDEQPVAVEDMGPDLAAAWSDRGAGHDPGRGDDRDLARCAGHERGRCERGGRGMGRRPDLGRHHLRRGGGRGPAHRVGREGRRRPVRDGLRAGVARAAGDRSPGPGERHRDGRSPRARPRHSSTCWPAN